MKNNSRIGDVRIVDIKTDESLVFIIDELKYRLKTGIPYSPMRADFNDLLNSFIKKYGLDWDHHNFARLPENLTITKKIDLEEKE